MLVHAYIVEAAGDRNVLFTDHQGNAYRVPALDELPMLQPLRGCALRRLSDNSIVAEVSVGDKVAIGSEKALVTPGYNVVKVEVLDMSECNNIIAEFCRKSLEYEAGITPFRRKYEREGRKLAQNTTNHWRSLKEDTRQRIAARRIEALCMQDPETRILGEKPVLDEMIEKYTRSRVFSETYS